MLGSLREEVLDVVADALFPLLGAIGVREVAEGRIRLAAAEDAPCHGAALAAAALAFPTEALELLFFLARSRHRQVVRRRTASNIGHRSVRP
ncbi:MAG: hypothetical protein FJ306_12295 [Planctomycetes bacterium]|nr:hypothetical protein [Planctomycetota bacterium]